ncbi:MAG: hypothetical protein QM503_15190 [Bacteroidota bacterium]
MNINKTLTILLILSVVWSCKTQQKVDSMTSKKDIITIDHSAGPTTFIYKTVGDYINLVPITLSDDKTKILSYPHPKDVYYKGKLAVPTQLEDGYLLDNRGISANVAFLNITYEEYSKLDKAPSTDELFEMIVDKNPLTDLYNCGNRYQYKDEVIELNIIISEKQLKQCRKMVGE